MNSVDLSVSVTNFIYEKWDLHHPKTSGAGNMKVLQAGACNFSCFHSLTKTSQCPKNGFEESNYIRRWKYKSLSVWSLQLFLFSFAYQNKFYRRDLQNPFTSDAGNIKVLQAGACNFSCFQIAYQNKSMSKKWI